MNSISDAFAFPTAEQSRLNTRSVGARNLSIADTIFLLHHDLFAEVTDFHDQIQFIDLNNVDNGFPAELL